jgi:Domain of unknown function (DUF4340)
MKKSTLILAAVALGLGAFVYFGVVKGKLKPTPTESAAKPVFASISADQLTSLTLDRAGKKLQFEKQGDDWEITSPIRTRADQSAVGGIATDLASAEITRTLNGAPEGMAAYGLAKPAMVLDFKLQDGQEHRIELGAKDFSGDSVYARVDGGKQVVLLPGTLYSAADKPLNELRDRSVLEITSEEIKQFDLKNRSGEIAGSKQNSQWRLEKPRAVAADASALDSLLDAVGEGKMTTIVSETPKGLSAYGLTHPQIEFRARDLKGGEHALLVGRKSSEGYYARDPSRPLIFGISAALHDKLAEKFFDLRNKSIVQFDAGKLESVSVRNPYQTAVCDQQSGGKWILEKPAGHKGKEVQSWRFLNPLETAQAVEIFDSAPADIQARLAKPAIDVILVDQSGKTTNIHITAPVGKFVYARTTAAPTVYKLNKADVDDLDFKLADLMG